MEWTSCVDDGVELWVWYDGFVESTGLGDILNYHEIESVFGDIFVVVENELAFLRCSGRENDGVVALK